MDLNHLELEEEDDSDAGLIAYYRQNMTSLRNKHLNLVDTSVLNDVAVMIHASKLYEIDWRGFATVMGITDNFTLDKIEVSANFSKLMPMYVTLKYLSRSHSLGHLIEASMAKDRLDILRHIQPYVKKLLEEKPITEIKRVVSTEEQASNSSINDINCTSEEINNLNSLSISSEDNNCSSESTTSVIENVCIELNVLQQNRVEIDCLPALVIQDSSIKTGSTSDVVKIHPSAPPEENIVVLIQHANSESSIAEQLSNMLKNEGIIVKLLPDFDFMAIMDPVGRLTAILKEVDFIVPIVSESFLEEVHPRANEKYLESPLTMDNRNLYQLVMNEYRFDKCVNFRVRPVSVPNMKRELLKYDLILCQALRLWEEVSKFISLLRKTKELIPKYPIN